MPTSTQLATPVLLLLFNRPDTTRRVFAAIRQARPQRLYLAADGPRPHHPTDAALCAEARSIVGEIDWPCEVFTLFRSVNLNCGLGPATAIDWFFRAEEEGIILEDDCVPAPSFFRFCEELLTRYRSDTRILHIGGNNFSHAASQPPSEGTDSYFFSTQVNSWGWATWRRAWQLYDFHLTHFQSLRDQGYLQGKYSSWLETRYRLGKIEEVLRLPQPPDVWDYQWHFTVVAHSGLCIVPAVNLVGNIGFGEQGTHTLDAQDEQANLPASDLVFPLQHPTHVLQDQQQDRQHFREFMLSRIAIKARKLLGRRTSQPAVLPAAAVPVPRESVSSNTQLV